MSQILEDRSTSHVGTEFRHFSFDCTFENTGVWAGMASLLEVLWPLVEGSDPHLIDNHRHALKYITPWLGSHLEQRVPLTEAVAEVERVRSYAADRAIRIPHDIARFIVESKASVAPEEIWILEFYHHAAIGDSARILVDALRSILSGDPKFRVICFDELPLPEENFSHRPQVSSQPAFSWEERPLEYLPAALHLSVRPQERVRLRLKGVSFLCSSGFYRDAARYADGLISETSAAFPEDRNFQWHVSFKCVNALLGAGQIEPAAAILEEVCPALTGIDSKRKSDLLYLRAMVCARFRSPRDLEGGEALLIEAIGVLDPKQLANAEYHFARVFLANGIAMIRMFQGRLDEALEITLNGIAELEQNLDQSEQRLHRSVLVYNVSQLYARSNRYTEALDAITQAITSDPYYSEYYNDRGSIHMALREYEEAIEDYRTALTLAPPYYEALTNLGQCYRATEQYVEGLNQFERAVLIEPTGALALVGGAACCQALGRDQKAIEHYDRAIELSPMSWELLANRAVSHYALDRFDQALTDIDLAIKMNPGNKDLLENRMTIAEAVSAPIS